MRIYTKEITRAHHPFIYKNPCALNLTRNTLITNCTAHLIFTYLYLWLAPLPGRAYKAQEVPDEGAQPHGEAAHERDRRSAGAALHQPLVAAGPQADRQTDRDTNRQSMQYCLTNTH